jgi:hypothetical protein
MRENGRNNTNAIVQYLKVIKNVVIYLEEKWNIDIYFFLPDFGKLQHREKLSIFIGRIPN